MLPNKSQKTLIGKNNKVDNTFVLLNNSYPLVNNEDESVFLVSKEHYFTVTSSQIKFILNNFLRYRTFSSLLRNICDVLVILGIFIAFCLILKNNEQFANYPIVNSILETRFINLLFGFSILGLLYLWYDFFHTKTHPIKLPLAKEITDKEIAEIKAVGFKFGMYTHLGIINFTNDDFLGMLCLYFKNNELQTYELFQHLVTETPQIVEIVRRSGVLFDTASFKKGDINNNTLPNITFTELRSLLTYSAQEALLTNSSEIGVEHLFLAIMKTNDTLQRFLRENNVTLDTFRYVCSYENELVARRNRTDHFNPNVPYYKNGGFANEWLYGYTWVLSHFSRELNKTVAGSKDTYGIGHDTEVSALASILGKVSNKNALLLGEPGVGKSSIILGLAQRINSGDVQQQLAGKKIIELDLNRLIAYAQQNNNMEETIIKTMDELSKAGNTILYIDEIQEIIPSKASGGSDHSLAGILLPYIINSKFPIIGSISYADYKKYLYSNESLRSSFTNVEIKEISPADTMEIMESKIPSLEDNFKCYITFPALTAAVDLAQRYIKERKLPSSAVQTIETTCAWAQANGVKTITAEHVAQAISIQKDINVTSITEDESNKLMKLEDNIRARVIGQDEAVNAVSEALRRARTDVRNPDRPIAVFLFIGPTGVGKTELAKVTGEEFFGTKNNLIRVDMSEYKEIDSVQKFLGGETGNVMGQSSISLIDKIKSKPNSVVLFDEIEKANPAILDLFLQLFDEGRLTSNYGETADFTNSIIICTSNIGSKILLDTLEKGDMEWKDAKSAAVTELKNTIKPELLNRYDKVIVFSPHDIKNLSKISELLLKNLADRLSQKGYVVKWSKEIPKIIATKANEPGLGARPLRRFIQDRVEGHIATEIIEGNLKQGDEIEIKEDWME
ncbi:ATP-dependent Clp protease ATP-binding subunit [bacterium]|nr:ATP-dependent Clp protease ATP-binding subunit [bacterium]